MIEKEFTEQEIEMQRLVGNFQQVLRNREFPQVKESLQVIRENLEPLNYWLPYKDLTDLLISKCSNKEIKLISPEEVDYLIELSKKLVDKDSEVGLQTIPEFYSKLETLKAERGMGRLGRLKTEVIKSEELEAIVMPSNADEKIREYRSRSDSRDEEVKGIWSAWEELSSLAENSQTLENMARSGVTADLTGKYLDKFMKFNLFSNVFQCNMSLGMLDHITDVFKLHFRLKQTEGVSTAEMPAQLEQQLYDALDNQGRSCGWPGTREFAIMDVSTKLAKAKFLGAEWKSYEPDKQCLEWVIDFDKKGETAKAEYVSGIANGCGTDFGMMVYDLANRAILDFTKSYIRDGVIDSENGELLWIAQAYSRNDFDIGLSQPSTYRAIIHASERGHKFAIDLVGLMDQRLTEEDAAMLGTMVDIHASSNETPYVDHIANEPREHLEHRTVCHVEQTCTEYLTQAPDVFRRALEDGSYISPVNECNSSVSDMEKLEQVAEEEIRALREQREGTDYIYVTNDVFFVFNRNDDKPQVYVGNPNNFRTFASLIGYDPSIISNYNPDKQIPERQLVIEFEDQSRRDKALKEITEGSFTHQPKDYKFHFSLRGGGDPGKTEDISWELV